MGSQVSTGLSFMSPFHLKGLIQNLPCFFHLLFKYFRKIYWHLFLLLKRAMLKLSTKYFAKIEFLSPLLRIICIWWGGNCLAWSLSKQ